MRNVRIQDGKAEYAIEVRGLNRKYPGFALKDVSFRIPEGSIVGVIGENGAGKSTTVKAILGLIKRDSGEITLLGEPDGAKQKALKEQIGVVFDESCFPESLSREDVNRIMKRIFRNWEEKRFFQLCEQFAVPAKRRMKEYSRGMKMKLAIAVAMSHQARLLILDEATSGLDPVIRAEILDMLREFVMDERHTVFLSSHITSDMEKIADYILLIHQGEILLYEDRDTLLEEYALVRCSEKQAEELHPDQIVGIRKGRFDTEVLVRSREGLENREDLVVDRVTLEDILLYTVGEPEPGRCEA